MAALKEIVDVVTSLTSIEIGSYTCREGVTMELDSDMALSYAR